MSDSHLDHTWDVDEFAKAAAATVDALASYVDDSQQGRAPVVRRKAPRELVDLLRTRRWLGEGGMSPDDYRHFLDDYLAEGVRLHHPAYAAHQVAPPDVPSALGDLLGKVGFGGSGAGVLTHGGSLGNLTGLLIARAAAAPDAWEHGVPGNLSVLAPPATHYSITRAAGILGLGSDAVLPVPVDPLGRIDVRRLPEVLGGPRTPMALVANACATATGLYDDLRGVGEFCRANGIWLHVDGAHGASALLSPKHRQLLDGIELADSVVWDAHKMLRTSGVAAAVLTRDAAALDAAFHQEASYLFYGEQRFDQVRHTIEGTKAQLGLKVFLNVAWRGEDGLGDYVARQYETAHRFWELAQEYPDVECPYEPESNIVCFRVGDGDQQALRDRLIDEGSFHLSSVELGGVRHLRLTAMSPATDEETLRALLRRHAARRHPVSGYARPDGRLRLGFRRGRLPRGGTGRRRDRGPGRRPHPPGPSRVRRRDWPAEGLRALRRSLTRGTAVAVTVGPTLIVLAQDATTVLATIEGRSIAGAGLTRAGLAGAADSIADAERALALAERRGTSVRFETDWLLATLLPQLDRLQPLIDPGPAAAQPYLRETVSAYAEHFSR
ncbi:Glutamate or tyrosine decarboxylase [Asanoa hainanensis]|uniref:Glutamate or tyrosine decarboxylase n=1 Tax=Asanoa hainanensis TaxID=560556 RepID=A0A239P9R8_9ACTN|nr:aminotransferase class V-fold PLP-dependent enzyme [Asanoa hainanensis]SNT63692.1 Glutamate or tyrosine decarboxylase [Asanoa hainanensis]